MKLFDIVGGKVVIHADFLAIPAMRRYWESSSDKDHVNKVLSFIILCDYWDSPYVKSMNDDIREEKLKEEFFGNSSYTLTKDEQVCRDEYARLLDTRNLKMLKAMRNKIDTVSSYYEESIGEELDNTRVRGNAQLNPYELA